MGFKCCWCANERDGQALYVAWKDGLDPWEFCSKECKDSCTSSWKTVDKKEEMTTDEFMIKLLEQAEEQNKQIKVLTSINSVIAERLLKLTKREGPEIHEPGVPHIDVADRIRSVEKEIGALRAERQLNQDQFKAVEQRIASLADRLMSIENWFVDLKDKILNA